MEDWTSIKLGVGIGSVKFGMTRDEVRWILSEPELIEDFEALDDGEVDKLWHYSEKGFTLHFSEDEGYRLTSIDTEDPQILLHNRSLIGLPKSKTDAVFEELHLGTPEPETFTSKLERISFDGIQLEIWIDDDQIITVEWGHLWLDENTPKWPE